MTARRQSYKFKYWFASNAVACAVLRTLPSVFLLSNCQVGLPTAGQRLDFRSGNRPVAGTVALVGANDTFADERRH